MPDPKTPAAVTPQAPAPAPVKPAQAPVAPVVPAKPPVTPAPAAIPPGVPPVPADGDKTMVPVTALHEEREKRQQLQLELEALKKVAGQNVLFDINGNPVYQQPQQQPQQQQDYVREIEKLWETDPRRAVQAEIYTAMAWRDQQEAALDQQEYEVMRKYPDYNDYRSEVRQYVRTLPLEQRGTKGVLDLAYYVVRGQKVDNIIAKTKQDLEQEFIRKMQSGEFAQGLPGGSISQPPMPQGVVSLTEEQKKAAAAMGIREEEYVKFLKG